MNRSKFWALEHRERAGLYLQAGLDKDGFHVWAADKGRALRFCRRFDAKCCSQMFLDNKGRAVEIELR